ncbi:HAD-IIIC family phosphatase, partial [Candidatus Woesearchaeota archaeon]|nr:HAD-IIIC family phosphatase [Candidatus Woesearchaeota archaeon]
MKLNDYINKSRKLSKHKSMKEIKIAFLSTFTINGLGEIMKVLCHDEKINVQTYVGPYGQYAQEILNTSSKLYSFNPNIIFMLFDAEQFLGDFFHFPYRLSADERKGFIDGKLNEIQDLVKTLSKNTDSKMVLNSLLVPHYSSRGIHENKQEKGLRKLIHYFNETLDKMSVNNSQLFIFDFNSFSSKIGHSNLVDRKMHYLGDLRISPQGLVDISKEYMAYIYPLASMTRKCIVLDLDNTLWGGVVGEDGLENIKLGPEKDGKPFMDFQKRILDMFERGIILAINSKNNYDDVKEVFKKHKYMILKEDKFACIKINWQDKVSNMKEISKELNIGLDSFVFFDDDKTNREMIKELLPEVLVVDMPDDPSLYPKTIEDLHVFNAFTLTKEDMKKGEMYAEQKKREDLKLKSTDIKSFLKELKIKTSITEANKFNTPRISQLTQKTNQFNLTTRRYQEEDIKKFSSSEDYIVKCIDVKDRFGDYGITGAVIVKKSKDFWEIDTFLLSCRILGKEIEFGFMKNILDNAKKAGVEVRAEFIPSKKNKPAENFLK